MDYKLLVEAFDDENPDDKVWNDELSFVDNVKTLWNRVTRYTDDDIVKPIVTAYSLLPHPLIKVAPIKTFNGLPGTGKTDSLRGLKVVRGLENMTNEQSSPKSLRNEIVTKRFHNTDKDVNPKEWGERVNFALLIDNMDSSFFKDEYNRAVWLGGNTRTTDIITVAHPDGGNISYPCFGLKAYSSVWVNDDPEVKRRLLTVYCQKCKDDDFIPLSLEGSEESWGYQFEKFWDDKTLCLEFLKYRQAFAGTKPKIEKARVQQFRGIYAMLKILDYDKPKQIIEAFENERNNSLEIFNPLSEVIKSLLGDEGVDKLPYIKVRQFNHLLISRQDELLEKPKASDIKRVMFNEGYIQAMVKNNVVWKKREQ
ncbi:hypothetical protein PN466_00780 [Roseofilum reptotaenium CS-1145]|uniref:Uncharacterized protein n=1 Tax=Roseofilum reptotaenium AO1-A TaxID=1925591 RepID=A0A1L9QKL8_9CYAN|nr:hypothetical protein [Roseofilum reptotaenium]MDB9515496.1 hypothetical protein [Roseofilum reptotaenium CS-1145]OJJ16933.1 hypothetical protein BI308_23240 [Roseofilum reptotaenium AO1-A]